MKKEPYKQLTTDDLALLEKLQCFIPHTVFDAHTHMLRDKHLPEGNNIFRIYGTISAERLINDQRVIYKDRKFGALLLPMPSLLYRDHPEIRDDANEWIAAELEKAPTCVGAVYVMPGDTAEQIEAMLTHPRIKGFKCYHQTAVNPEATFLANIGEYLPESAWQVANKYGMSITLHMVKPLALADPENMAYIKEMSTKYPNAKLILAHCARGFAAWTTIESVRELRGISNIYYDLAAICDPATIAEVIRQAGSDHVMWGSDYAIDRACGKPISCGLEFRWLYSHELPENVDLPTSWTVIESLFAFYQASLLLDLTPNEVECIFYKNGMQMYGLM